MLAEDKLFATLDPTTRKLRMPNNQNILLSDTVGFLRKLPHHLVESFKATLEEVAEADLLLHVVDVSHPQAREQIKAVEVVLQEIEAWGKPTVVALNKIDIWLPGDEAVGRAGPARRDGDAADGRLGEPCPPTMPTLEKFQREFEHAVPISAKTGQEPRLVVRGDRQPASRSAAWT